VTESLLLNGTPLRSVDPGLLRATSYGHFTSMQVRDGRVDGLDLHFERLDRSSREVFGQPVSADRVRSYLRIALDQAGSGDLSIRVNAFASDDAEPNLLIRVGPPVEPAVQPVRLLAFQNERAVPHLKHTGTFDLVYYGRQARLAGYDDAVFHTAGGEISEASVWNICFAYGPEIVFPLAPVLDGIRQQILQRGLETFVEASIPLIDLPTYDAAYLTNSIDPALPVTSITVGGRTISYEEHPASAEVIAASYATLPPQAI
jgi:branched-chain amino acid aminotransferase